MGHTRSKRKKQTDFSKVEFFTYHEGLCVQCMHIGPYDNEPVTAREMEQYAKEQGYSWTFPIKDITMRFILVMCVNVNRKI